MSDGVWELRQNGHAIRPSEANLPPTLHTTWMSKGDLLLIGRSPFAQRPAWQAWLIGQFNRRVSGHRFVDDVLCLRVHKVEKDRFEGIETEWPDVPLPDPGEIEIGQRLWFDAKREENVLGWRPHEFVRIR